MHNLNTKFSDFYSFLNKYYIGFLEELTEFFDHLNDNEKWNNFEDLLSFINDSKISELLRLSKYYLKEEGLKVIKNVSIYLNSIKKSIENHLKEWIYDINENYVNKTKKRFEFNSNDKFINFNYTGVLEKIYNIEKDKILYIHGSIENKNDRLIFGHNNSSYIDYINEVVYWPGFDDELDIEDDLLLSIGEDIKKFKKPVNNIINNNGMYFRSGYKEIIVLGHSYSINDYDYFNFLFSNNLNAKYILHYHDQNTLENLNKLLNSNNLSYITKYDSIEIEMYMKARK